MRAQGNVLQAYFRYAVTNIMNIIITSCGYCTSSLFMARGVLQSVRKFFSDSATRTYSGDIVGEPRF